MIEIENTDAITFLRSLEPNSVDCFIYSPPYLALRQYSVSDYVWESVSYSPMPGLPEITIPEWQGELGLEPTVEMYIGHLLLINREAKRVLKPTGNLFLNIADKHGRGTRALWDGDSKRQDKKRKKMFDQDGYAQSPAVLKEKSLVLVPQRIALALDADGWYVRGDYIWDKVNPLPGSQQDRFTISHEYVFHLTKQPNYWFDLQAVAEPVAESTIPRSQRGVSEVHKMVDGAPGQSRHSMMKPRQNAKMSGGDFSKKYAGAQIEHGAESHRKPYLTRTKRSVMHVESDACECCGQEVVEYGKSSVMQLSTIGSAYDYCRCGRLYLGSERAQIRGERTNPDTGETEKIMTACLNCGKDDNYVSHFAAYSRNLIEPLILSGCPPMVCSTCGTPYQRMTKRVGGNWEKRKESGAPGHYGMNNNKGQGITSYEDEIVYFPPTDRKQRKRAEELFIEGGLTQAHLDAIRAVGIADTGKALVTTNGAGKNDPEIQQLANEAKQVLGGYYREFLTANRETLGWKKMCKCQTDQTRPGVVADFFSGSGTTAMTALVNERDFIGCELNPDYHALSLARIERWREDPQFRSDDEGITPEQLERGDTLGHSKPVMINLFGVD
jgi:DNA modification methylase